MRLGAATTKRPEPEPDRIWQIAVMPSARQALTAFERIRSRSAPKPVEAGEADETVATESEPAPVVHHDEATPPLSATCHSEALGDAHAPQSRHHARPRHRARPVRQS